VTLAPLALVVVAALIHATWNLLAKRAAGVGPVFVLAYTLVACVAYAPWVVWLLAHGALTWTAPVAVCIALSGAVHLGYNLCLQRGYQVADLSVVYPVARGTGPMLASLAAFLLLGEAVTGQGLLGLAAVVLGIFLISTQGDVRVFRTAAGRAGVGWGLVTGALIAGYTVIDAWGVKILAIEPVILDWCANMARLAMLAPFVLGKPSRAHGAMSGFWRFAVPIGVLSPLGYIFVLGALDMGAPLSVVAPAREMSMMAGALFGMVFLGERVGPVRLAGCAVMIAGVALLAAR
jgi:drug/metabolite transporter (DMT)-like permease